VTSFETSAPFVEGNTFDQCGGHCSHTDKPSYHAHVPPSCLLRQLGQTGTTHSPQVGWAFDGFPVYGPRGPGGVMMQTCTVTGGVYGRDVCTDDCGGYYRADNSIDNFAYRYYMLGDYNDGLSCALPGCPSPGPEYHPASPVCYRGCCPSGATCHSTIPACPASPTLPGTTSGYSASVPTINGLNLASGLPQNTEACSCASLQCSDCSSQHWDNDQCRDPTGTCPASALSLPDDMAVAPTPWFVLVAFAMVSILSSLF